MCCGRHDHGPYRVRQRVHPPETPALTTVSCPECGYPTQEDFVLCPRCGTELLTACPQCHRAVKADWARCAYCGADLAGA
jgi:RNA polymerase subunit RPABC4/transcription elongation factor Spt4